MRKGKGKLLAILGQLIIIFAPPYILFLIGWLHRTKLWGLGCFLLGSMGLVVIALALGLFIGLLLAWEVLKKELPPNLTPPDLLLERLKAEQDD